MITERQLAMQIALEHPDRIGRMVWGIPRGQRRSIIADAIADIKRVKASGQVPADVCQLAIDTLERECALPSETFDFEALKWRKREKSS